VGRRRFTPLIVLLVCGALLLMARLFTVQILERDIWVAQAQALVRQGKVEPYTRGEIRDRRGQVLARDVEGYRIEAEYRDFRRGNALGIVAHALSALQMRPVGLAEPQAQLGEWAVALARLSPAALARFQHGGALACGGIRVPACEEPADQARSSRAMDLGFYATALFDLSSKERAALKKLKNEGLEQRFVDFVAEQRELSREELEALIRARCEQDQRFLADFARLWAAELRLPQDTALASLIAQLEQWRADVEDGAAGDLFDSATGFAAGRLDAESLYEFIDLGWIARCLYWDEARLRAWTRSARARWLAQRDGPLLDFAVERLRRERDRVPPASLVSRELAVAFVQARRRRDEVQAADPLRFDAERAMVLGDFDKLFDLDLPDELHESPALPLFDAEFCDALEQRPEDLSLLARIEFWRGDGVQPDAALLAAATEQWRARFDPRFDVAGVRAGFESLFLRLEDAFQAELLERLIAAREVAREDGKLDGNGRLPLASSCLERAEERVRHILKDRGSRSFVAVARPEYPLVNLLTRYPEHLRGFDVARVQSRVHPTRDAQDRVVARLLLGRIAPPSVARRLSQAELVRQLAELEHEGDLDEAAEEQLANLRAAIDRPDEQIGSSGLERWFEPELAGRNGYRETVGLGDDERERRARAALDKVDGRSITSTIDALLQQEGEYCLEHPDGDRDNPGNDDDAWLANPTGAIVLLSPQGDVLVAASVPLVDRSTQPGRRPITDDVRERTLTKPDFQPPGSVFKPFVAAWALDHLQLDPRAVRECSAAANPGGRGPGYGGVHCHETRNGHGSVDLHRALCVSCNSYFAWLGEQYDVRQLDLMAREFGFGEPTGVRSYGDTNRSGILEHTVADLFRRPGRPVIGRSLREAGNGLSVVEATPMQVARATAALATGSLPTLRLVSHIDGVEIPRDGRPLRISPQALQIVRRAMQGVSSEDEGSGHAALAPAILGFSMAAKTGSADLTSAAVEDGRVLKHTWVAGWFPAEDPVGILVVFVHRTTRTSSHGAVWLARQFLTRPAVAAWIAEAVSTR